MTPDYDVISDFLDDDPFDPMALGEALASADGKAMLIDFILLRHAARTDVPITARRTSALRWPVAVAAAAVIVALIGGYQLGYRQNASAPNPPDATRVVQAPGWTVTAGGGN